MKEEYRDVVGFEGRYQISNFGNLRSLLGKKPKQMGLVDNGNGYLRNGLRTLDGKYKTMYAHRMVAQAFLGYSNLEVNHIDGDKSNNHLSNLEWVTHKENQMHMTYNLRNSGTKMQPCVSILPNGDIANIYLSESQAAREFGVFQGSIRNARVDGREFKGYRWLAIK